MKALIAANAPRRQTWLDIFGTDTVEVLSASPRISPDGRKSFQLDMAALTVRQLAMLTRCLSQHWKIPVDQAQKRMAERGVWIDAEDVFVAEYPMLF